MKTKLSSLEMRKRKKEWLIQLQAYKKILLPHEQNKDAKK
jgi:hypothetical protein